MTTTNEGNLEDYLKASEIGKKIFAHAKRKVKAGIGLLELAEEIEAAIKHEGMASGCDAKPAFPVNLSINEAAAHYTPCIGDEKLLEEKDLIKVDFGLHVQGCIIDCAFSMDLSGERGALAEASEQALQDALATMKSGVCVREVGRAIEKAISSKGFKPVENLCGHMLLPFELHAGEEIPNVPRGNYTLKEGDVFAVEPFATNGRGRVSEGAYCEIFSLVEGRQSRMQSSREVLEHVAGNYGELPFARRWLAGSFPAAKLNLAVRDLLNAGALRAYPVLNESKGSFVSQAETTVIIEKDSVCVLV
jgi:methionyl aminopeptidase